MSTALQDCEFLWAKHPASEATRGKGKTHQWMAGRQGVRLPERVSRAAQLPLPHRPRWCLFPPWHVIQSLFWRFASQTYFLFMVCNGLCIFDLAIPFILNFRSFLATTDILSLPFHRIKIVCSTPTPQKSNSSCILEMALPPLVFLRCLKAQHRAPGNVTPRRSC